MNVRVRARVTVWVRFRVGLGLRYQFFYLCASVQISSVFQQYKKSFLKTFTMQIISTMVLYNCKVPVIIKKKFTFCPGQSRENLPNIFQDFPGLMNKIQGLSRTFQNRKKNPGLSRTFPGCGNPVHKKVIRF